MGLSPTALSSVITGEISFAQQFADFVVTVDQLVRTHSDDETILCRLLTQHVRPLLKLGHALPESFTKPNGQPYRRELLHEAEDGAFSIGAFTWFPNHASRIHDHHSWAVLGNMTGMLRSENFLVVTPDHVAKHAPDNFIPAGAVMWSTRATGDIHRISVASKEQSTSIHIYGCRFEAVNRNYYSE